MKAQIKVLTLFIIIQVALLWAMVLVNIDKRSELENRIIKLEQK